MTKQKCYIIGKMTGLPRESVKSKFMHASIYIQHLGFEPVNPTQLIPTEEKDEDKAMEICFEAITKCPFVFLLPDWTDSKNGKKEVAVSVVQNKAFINGFHDIKYNMDKLIEIN